MISKYDIGLHKMRESMGKQGDEILELLGNDFQDIGRYILELVFADLGSRDILHPKYREMITLVSLITQGDTASQIEMHIQSALNVGLSKEEIIETIIQCIPHIGFPKVLNAVWIAKSVFGESSRDGV